MEAVTTDYNLKGARVTYVVTCITLTFFEGSTGGRLLVARAIKQRSATGHLTSLVVSSHVVKAWGSGGGEGGDDGLGRRAQHGGSSLRMRGEGMGGSGRSDFQGLLLAYDTAQEQDANASLL